MRKTAAVFIVILLLAAVVSAHALTIEAGTIRPFDDNILTVSSDDGGKLTIEAISGTIPLENPVTDLPVEGGTVEVHWDALTYHGEPLTPGWVTLRATLKGSDRTVEEAEIRLKIGSPVPAALCCLPAAQEFYPDGKHVLRIEVGVSAKGTYEVSIARKDNPGELVWNSRTTYNGRGAPMVLRWDGKGIDHRYCPPGEYIITARSVVRDRYVHTAEITIPEEPLPEPELAVTGSLLPEDLEDDAAVWAALTAPVAVGDGGEGQGLSLEEQKNARWSGQRAGAVNCRTVGLAILELYDDGWAKVAAWRQPDGEYTEGYVKKEKLKMVRPNTRYGAVMDKGKQTMTVYENGKRIGTVKVSTGRVSESNRLADTRCGVYLLGTRLDNFTNSGYAYSYPVRIDGTHLIHQMGYVMKNGGRDFSAETETLGTMASHGCIRIDAHITEENNGINAWWVWTHMGRDSKIIVIPGE